MFKISELTILKEKVYPDALLIHYCVTKLLHNMNMGKSEKEKRAVSQGDTNIHAVSRSNNKTYQPVVF